MSERDARDYFEVLASFGVTKHIGSMEATREIVERTHIESGDIVLDIGCGVGVTPVYLAREIGCRAVGVDLLESMLVQAQARAKAKCVEDRVEFVAADARRLPFVDDHFDAVISESVSVFLEDKREGIGEFRRVTRPGGYVGITEMTWRRPPRSKSRQLFKRTVYAEAYDAAGWKAVLEEAGLKDVRGDAHAINARLESKGRFERYGCWGVLVSILRMPLVLARDRKSRAFIKDVLSGGMGGLSRDLFDEMGYGVFVGRKS